MKNDKKRSARKPTRSEHPAIVHEAPPERKAQPSPGSAYDLPRFAMARFTFSAIGTGGRRVF